MASFIARGLRRTYLYAGSHLPFAGIKGTNFISLVIFPFSELALSYSVLVYNAINELTSIVNSMLYILHHILLVSFILYASRFLVLGPWHQRLHNDFQFSSGLWSTGCQSSNGLSTKQDAFSSNNSQTQSYSDSLIIISCSPPPPPFILLLVDSGVHRDVGNGGCRRCVVLSFPPIVSYIFLPQFTTHTHTVSLLFSLVTVTLIFAKYGVPEEMSDIPDESNSQSVLMILVHLTHLITWEP